jgi:hypothetical protein
MTDVPFAAVSGNASASARPLHPPFSADRVDDLTE